ncbi:MAG: lipid A deacylase LpxR family protein [Lentisphaerae bacterium]|nr:lipid A deacylase LpxR family protein [Lentisphaerota bacterium]
MIRICLAWFCLVVAALAACAGTAPAGARPRPNDLQSLTVYYENDLFTDTDRYYTSGVRLSWLSQDLEAKDVPAWAHATSDRLPWLRRDGWTNNLGLALGQCIYTPEKTAREVPDPKDRPYAGWLYGSVALHHKNATRLHMLELTLGIVGPEALGEVAQNGVHDVRHLRKAKGWDHQLGTEPGLMLTYDYRQRLGTIGDPDGVAADLLSSLRLNAGNVLTAATAGVTGRIGWNLPRDFHGSRIHASGYATPPADADTIATGRSFSLFLYATAEGSAVAHNLFLDGNTFRDSPSVDRQPWVGGGELGAGCSWSRYRLTYSHVVRSKEFHTQDGAQQYGSICLSVSF